MASNRDGPDQAGATIENMPRSEYQYGDAIGEDQLRILTLEPSTEMNAIILCGLRIVERNTTPYEALSYCCGDPEPTTTIVVDGFNSKIRPALAAALRYLRLPDSRRTLWVDAICIHQQDLDEKSKQVKLMGVTYSKAAKVIVWLGPPSDEEQSTLALQAIDSLGSQLDDKKLKEIPFFLKSIRSFL